MKSQNVGVTVIRGNGHAKVSKTLFPYRELLNKRLQTSSQTPLNLTEIRTTRRYLLKRNL